MSAKLSPSQEEVVRRLRESGQDLVRVLGGFWTLRALGEPFQGVPAWYVTTNTVKAMERRGLLERTSEYPEYWRDSRRLARDPEAAARFSKLLDDFKAAKEGLVRVCLFCERPTQSVVVSQDTHYCPRCRRITATKIVPAALVRQEGGAR